MTANYIATCCFFSWTPWPKPLRGADIAPFSWLPSSLLDLMADLTHASFLMVTPCMADASVSLLIVDQPFYTLSNLIAAVPWFTCSWLAPHGCLPLFKCWPGASCVTSYLVPPTVCHFSQFPCIFYLLSADIFSQNKSDLWHRVLHLPDYHPGAI